MLLWVMLSELLLLFVFPEEFVVVAVENLELELGLLDDDTEAARVEGAVLKELLLLL